MVVNFSSYITNHCDYCAKSGSASCEKCCIEGKGIPVPSEFLSSTKIGEDYFKLLAKVTNFMSVCGIEIKR